MGRPSKPHFDDYVPQEKFRLIKREGIYLMNDRWMMINFLKSDHSTQNISMELQSDKNTSQLSIDSEIKKEGKDKNS